jgi:outer membrane protein assembly factor BamB
VWSSERCGQGYAGVVIAEDMVQLDDSLGKVGMTCAEGKLYLLGHRGTLSLLDITSQGFDIISQFDLPKKPTNSYLAHPVVCAGRLYIRSHENLFVYDVRAR